MKSRPGFVVVSVLVALLAAPTEASAMNTILGTGGDDVIVGTAARDRIAARGGDDRVNGRQRADLLIGSKGRDRITGAEGRDRLVGGSGADHLNAVDGKADRVVNGGRGRDVCVIDRADRPALKNCERVRVRSGTGGGGSARCIADQEAKVRGALDSSRRKGGDGGPPRFSAGFYGVTITLKASVDGLDGNQLPLEIEQVCDVPKGLRKDAVKLAGGDGVAIVGSNTKVVKGGKTLDGAAARQALDNADTANLRAWLKHRDSWAQDEDGNPVPTFGASRIQITD
ncbi:MAG TPA: calcium-binding protein [Actinomycetota bacterium]|nr:calcium-binding protein [Actinomycetota bacterium]